MKMKKTLLLMLLMICTFGLFGCKRNKEIEVLPDDPTPILPFGDTVYMTVKQGEVTYNVTKDEMFVKLRNELGLTAVIDWADKVIVQNFSKRDLYKKLSNTQDSFEEIDDTTYWDMVTDEEIRQDMINEYFPGGTIGYTEEEVNKILEEDYIEEVYGKGFRTYQDLVDFYHLRVAKRKCVADYNLLLRQADPYTEGQMKTFYNQNYTNNYWLVILPFNDYTEFEGTLNQLGYSISTKDPDNENDYNKWINTATQEEATPNEVAQIFIDLYNKTMYKKEDAQTTLELLEGTDYKIENGNIVFSTDGEANNFYYAGSDLKAISADLLTGIEALSLYSQDATSASYYTPRLLVADEANYLILKIQTDEAPSYEEVKEDLPQVMMSSTLTDDNVAVQMSYIRWINDFVIYDGLVRYSYNNTFEYTVTEDAVSHDTYVAVIGVRDKKTNSYSVGQYTKETMFNDMDYAYGPYIASEVINYYNFLYNKEVNRVYDLTLDTLNDNDRILNSTIWEWVVSDVKGEKENFLNNEYLMFGYPASYGWENFLMEAHGVLSEKDLALLFLRTELMETYINDTAELAGKSSDSEIWRYFDENMNILVNAFYRVDGLALTLTYVGSNGQSSNPDSWTDEQKALVEQFYQEVISYLKVDLDEISQRIEALIHAYNIAPYLLGSSTTPANAIYSGMNLSIYKTAGIKLYSNDLGTFTNGYHGISIDEVAKEIWDNDPTSEETIVYEGDEFIANSEGYVVYINTKCHDLPRLDEDGRLVPTLEEIQLYLADVNTTELSDEVKEAISNVYIPLSAELGTIYYLARDMYKDQANYEITFRLDNYTYDEYQKILLISIAEAEAQLNYTK